MRRWICDAKRSSIRTSASPERPIATPPNRSKRSPESRPPPLTTTSHASDTPPPSSFESGWKPVASGAGAVVPRSSFSALRATQNRNRYRTARKPNLSATATGSDSMRLLLDVEDEPRRPERDLVAGRQPRALHPAPVDLHAVRRVEVDDLPVPRLSAAQLGVLARDVRITEHAIGLPGPSEDRGRPVEHVAPIVHRDYGARLDQARPRLATLLLLLLRGAVHHRVPLLALHGLLTLAGRRLDQPGLDPELPQPQAVVRLQRHLGSRQQRVIAPPGMLEQIAGQLLLERALVSLEAPVVLARQEHRVLVGHVHLRHGSGPVGVHLLGELAGDLDRLNLRAECTAEHAFDEALDPGFEIAQNAHHSQFLRRAPLRVRRRRVKKAHRPRPQR